jgi:hypothetical protein
MDLYIWLSPWIEIKIGPTNNITPGIEIKIGPTKNINIWKMCTFFYYYFLYFLKGNIVPD